MYQRVVVAYDGSDRSLAVVAHAQQVADAWGSPVELLHVTDAGERPPDVREGLPRLVAVEGEDAVGTLVGTGEEDGTLLCMATRGRSAVADALFGGVARQVLRRLHAPVLVGGPRLTEPARTSVRRILLALDGSPAAAAILPVVRLWATSLSVQVVVVHVVYPPGAPGAGPHTLPAETRAILPELERTTARLRDDDGVDAELAVVEDTDAAAGLLRQAAHRMVDLVVMASHGRTGLERALVGSTTRAVFRGASVPVLTLRPRVLG